jgi:hypothetical protein
MWYSDGKRKQSYRRLGVALVFVISYSNYNKWGDKTITYTYTVYRAPSTSFNFNELTPTGPNGRLWRKRAGVQVSIIIIISYLTLKLVMVIAFGWI